MIEKVTILTSKELLISMFGSDAVHSYEDVKVGSMRLGKEIADYLILAVGGRVGGHKDGYDGLTKMGNTEFNWEFCLDRGTKNGAGNAHDQERARGRCVQILGKPNKGWMSAEEFLYFHHHDPLILLEAIEAVRSQHGHYGQLRLKI